MDSVPNDEECLELYNQLSKLWQSVGKYAKKWLLNSQIVVNKIPQEDKVAKVDLDKGICLQ